MIRRLTHVGPMLCKYHGHAYGRVPSDRANTDTMLYLLFTILRLSLRPCITGPPPPSQLARMFVLCVFIDLICLESCCSRPSQLCSLLLRP